MANQQWQARLEVAKHSLFYIRFAARPGMLEEIRTIADRVQSIPNDKGKRTAAVEHPGFCIGFASESADDGYVRVTTTAHALSHLYAWWDPLTAEKLELYTAAVVCYHQEEARERAGAPQESRRYVGAEIVVSAWAQDILVLRVAIGALRTFGGGGGVCPWPHPHLQVAPGSVPLPRPFTRCMMLARPSPDVFPEDAIGWVSCCRAVGMMCHDDHGYNMMLIEVYLDSAAGMSGAPLLDAAGRVIGMLHGGFGSTHSYFVASRHFYRCRRQRRPRDH